MKNKFIIGLKNGIELEIAESRKNLLKDIKDSLSKQDGWLILKLKDNSDILVNTEHIGYIIKEK